MKTGNSERTWLSEFEKQFNFGESFYAQMDAQLSPKLYALQPGNISGFKLMPPFGMDFAIEERDGVKVLDAQLLHIDVVFPVRVVWTEKEGQPHFGWAHLPDDEIAQELAGRKELGLSKQYPFELDVQNPVWPHVLLEFTFGAPINAAELEKELYDLINDWEQTRASEGAVHNAGKLKNEGDNTYSLKIDFGSTGKSFLEALLDMLEKWKVKKVVLDTR